MCRRTRLQTPPTRQVRVFVLSQGQRDDGANSIVIVGSNGNARGNVHHGRCSAAADNGDADDGNAANDDADGDADNILC
jgi:hypothetical protein